MIHVHVSGVVTHEPQRRRDDAGAQFLRVRCDCRSANQGRERTYKVVAELVGSDMSKAIRVGDAIEIEGSGTVHVVTDACRAPFAVLVIRARRVRVAPVEPTKEYA